MTEAADDGGVQVEPRVRDTVSTAVVAGGGRLEDKVDAGVAFHQPRQLIELDACQRNITSSSRPTHRDGAK